MGSRGFSLGPLNLFFCAINTVNTSISSLQSLVAAKQDKLTFDTTPTSGSSNPITSGGVYTAIKDMSSSSPVIFGNGTLYRLNNARYSNEGSTTITLSGTYIQVRLSSSSRFASDANGIIYIGEGSATSNSSFPAPGTITGITANYAISTKYIVEYLDPLIGVINSSESCISSTSFTAECSIMYIHDSSKHDPIGRCSAKIYNTTYEILEYTLYEKNGKIPIVYGKSTMDGSIYIIIHHII